MNKWWFGLALGLGFGGVIFAAPASSGKLVAKGLGFTVKQSELESAYRQFVLSQAVSGSVVPTEMEVFFRKQVLDELIIRNIAATRATAGDRGQAYIQSLDSYKDLRSYYISETAFILRIQSLGFTTNAYRLHLQNNALTQQVLKRELKSKTMVKDTEIEGYYNKNHSLWKVPAIAEVVHVLLAKVDLVTGRKLNPDERAFKQSVAAKVLRKARVGVSMKQLALEFSEDMSTKEIGGKLQIVQGSSSPVFERKVFALRPSQIEMVESDFGYHIVKVASVVPARTRKLPEVSREIRNHLHVKKYLSVLSDYVSLLRRQASVIVLLD